MGAWGPDAWDNDTAADWLGDLVERTNLVKEMDQILHLDLENYELIRAAASLLRVLGRPFIWPSEHRTRQRKLAASKLQEMLDRNLIQEEFARYRVSEEIEALASDDPPSSRR